MTDRFLHSIKHGVRYVRDHPGFLLTLVLIIVIPFAFLFSAQQFLRVSLDNQERLEKEKIGLLHDIFAQLVLVSDSSEVIQESIIETARLNPDITKFRIVSETDEGLLVVASLDETLIGSYEDEKDFYQRAFTHEGESLLFTINDSTGRAWQGVRVFGEKDTYFIMTETSLASLDALIAGRVTTAYIWLFILLFVVLALVLRHVRLIDYSYLYRQVKQANDTKDLFTNVIVHELRAPLTAMRGYASMIRENEHVVEDVREQGSRIEASTERLLVIVNDLLDVARIQSKKLKIESEKFDVSVVVKTVLESLESNAQEKNITLRHLGTAQTHFVNGDEKRMHQALTNLVNNAIKYTREGSIEVSIEDRRDRVELRVKDTGMGISSRDQKKLFAPFFRAEDQDISGITGTGLGMWITKHLLELMGASVGVESIKGVGTHIVVTLPKQEKS